MEIIRCIIFIQMLMSLVTKNMKSVKNNTLPKSELVTLILENKKKQAKEFDLTGIYKFEINLEEDQIKNFISLNHIHL